MKALLKGQEPQSGQACSLDLVAPRDEIPGTAKLPSERPLGVLGTSVLDYCWVLGRLRELLRVCGSKRYDDSTFEERLYLRRVDEAMSARTGTDIDNDAIENVGLLVSENVLKRSDPASIDADDIYALADIKE